MVFQTKKNQHETLGEYLVEIRQQLDLDAAEAAGKTGIKQKFLQKLEAGDFAGLPPDVYVFGFLRQMAQLYSVEPEPLIEQYKKERGEALRLEKNNSARPAGSRYLRKIIITPKFFGLAAGLLFVVVTVGYIIWQVLSINKSPSLAILRPQDHELIGQTSVDVAGKTDPGMSVTLNGQSVFVDEAGNFKTQVGLAAGPRDLVFVASNKFGKQVSRTISVIGQGQLSASSTSLSLNLQFSAAVAVSVVIDDGMPENFSFSIGDSHTFNARRKIMLSTSNAGATRASLNGQNLGALGRPGEKLTNVPFSAASDTISPH